MTELSVLEQTLAGAWVEPEVFALRPDYWAVLLAVDGLVPGPSDEAGAVSLQEAEAAARRAGLGPTCGSPAACSLPARPTTTSTRETDMPFHPCATVSGDRAFRGGRP